MSKQSKSPYEVLRSLTKLWLLLCILTLGSCVAGYQLDKPYTEKTTHNATLELAYSSMQKCGKHASCEEFMGRFKADDGQMYDREIDGFFYQRFVEQGRKPLPAYLTLNKNQMGVETPGWIQFLLFNGALFAMCFLGGGLMLGMSWDIAEYDQRDWEREQEKLARQEKYKHRGDW